ncbi:MAG TPA: lysylphosphatidylglycerol synthase transmembrane domain-containing protein [Ktedonobacterales bacterium]|nr:lysylphosphatidylglycerol synthase transmembrane domain-containing protein [Ktedonobacterales bacterium]
MKRLLRPTFVIPVVLGAALVVAFLTIADVRKVFALALGFQRAYLLYFFLLMLVYTLVRGVQWHYLLDRLDIRAPVRSQVFAFAVGEITKSLPIGNYFQNYLLKLSQGTNFARSAVATTLILATEVAVSLVALLGLGLGDWSDWLRPAILIGTAAFVLLCVLITLLRGAARLPVWFTRARATQRFLAELEHYRGGVRALARPRVLGVETVLCAIYLLTAAVGLYVIARGLGVTGLSLWQAAAVYFFSLAVGLILPLPVDFGVIEVSGIGALLIFGVGDSAAVAIMLLNRVFSTASAIVIAFAAIAVLRGEFVATLRAGSARRDTRGTAGARDAEPVRHA